MKFRPLTTTCFVTALGLSSLSLTALADSSDITPEDWNAHAQLTYIYQHKPAFAAPYSGQNSLSPNNEESYTFTTTAYLGARLWQGGEVYLNPEITLGVPFSNLTGTGGFTNGEITRTAGTTPLLYRQRLFLRQTWNLGGEREELASGINQLAGYQDSNRVVLTLGNFSTLDIFDNNTYAKDPRNQFMNWGNMTYAAYDYAADARGFGWGFAAEWYQGDWALRFGRMTGPKEPNVLDVDYHITRHYGDQLEIEHDHTLNGLPGAVRLLLWRNRANLASYNDALAYGQANPGLSDHQYILQVRNGDKTKYGVGINVEQALADDIGWFMRAMNADGRTETYAFTEVDRSFSTGLAIQGKRWNRSADTLGIALLRNGLSADRRNYLAAGGISFFIGDGQLNYRPEQIFESYYNWNIRKGVWLTGDYQYMQNPAYNTDRGPVKFLSLRLHAEY